MGVLPQSEQKSQSPERRAGVLRLLVSGYAGKVRRKLVFPWMLAKNQWQASPLPGAGMLPRCPGIPRSVKLPAVFQSIGFHQKVNHLRFAGTKCFETADKTHPGVESTASQGLGSPHMGANLMERN